MKKLLASLGAAALLFSVVGSAMAQDKMDKMSHSKMSKMFHGKMSKKHKMSKMSHGKMMHGKMMHGKMDKKM